MTGVDHAARSRVAWLGSRCPSNRTWPHRCVGARAGPSGKPMTDGPVLCVDRGVRPASRRSAARDPGIQRGSSTNDPRRSDDVSSEHGGRVGRWLCRVTDVKAIVSSWSRVYVSIANVRQSSSTTPTRSSRESERDTTHNNRRPSVRYAPGANATRSAPRRAGACGGTEAIAGGSRTSRLGASAQPTALARGELRTGVAERPGGSLGGCTQA